MFWDAASLPNSCNTSEGLVGQSVMQNTGLAVAKVIQGSKLLASETRVRLIIKHFLLGE